MQDVGANAIYSAYPRKQGEPSALKSIQRAILRIEKDKTLSRQDAVAWLLERTVKYARETAGTEQRFIKLPAGWFNDARYNDETPPATGAHMNPRVYIDEALLKTLAAPAATGEHMNPAASVNEWLVASAVMDRCRLSGIQLRVVLTDLVRQEADAGADPAALTDRMVWAWEEYTKAKPKLKYSPKAEIFFGGGDWRNPKGWAWKD